MVNMNSVKLLIFDLDGTLVESDATIFLSTIKTLEQLGIEHNITREEFKKYIGWHFQDIFNTLGVVVPDLDEYLKIYKLFYNTLLGESNLYPGVNEILYYLKKKDYKIALLTTKMQDQAENILSYFQIDFYFDYIFGRRVGIAHKPSPEPLFLVCNELNIKPEEAIMIGDSEMGIECGKNAGSKTLAVSFGYREKDFLAKMEPDYLIDSLIDIKNIF